MVHLSETQIAIRDLAISFCKQEVAPFAVSWDERKHFPMDVFRKAAALGLGGIYTSDEFGGSGLGRHEAVIVFEALAKGCPSFSAFLSIHNMATWMIDVFGSPEQRAKWIPKLVSMESFASYCLTEPGCGSDAAALTTRCTRDGDFYIINGAKQFISGAGSSDFYVTMVRTGANGPSGISAIVVAKEAPGLSFGANEKKMGWNCQPTRTVLFENCKVPVSCLLGKEGDGFKIAMKGLDGGRLNIAACSLGGAQTALEKTLSYTAGRKAFGSSLNSFQALRFKLAEMATDLTASRALLYSAAEAFDRGDADITIQAAMAKRFVTDTCSDVVDQALQLHGGYGYLSEYGIEKLVRDLRVHRILEGTNEIMNVIIARSMIETKIQ